MSHASIKYAASGRTYAVPFPYISKSHVVVTVDETPVLFSWASEHTVTLVVQPRSGAVVEVGRITPIPSRLVDFADSSVPTEDKLGQSVTQLLYLVQENADGAPSPACVSDPSCLLPESA
ncbi:phage tail fiber domain-containing protein [Methylorubrum thiocyanatum]|uniref:phage tail fiber domain-containing protein n=1 Tax=Methylorubrum thiocyanatum TaxID=47958 RepID=UPI000A78360C